MEGGEGGQEAEGEGGEGGNKTVWYHPPPYVLSAKWVMEGLLLPIIGSIGVIGN